MGMDRVNLIDFISLLIFNLFIFNSVFNGVTYLTLIGMSLSLFVYQVNVLYRVNKRYKYDFLYVVYQREFANKSLFYTCLLIFMSRYLA